MCALVRLIIVRRGQITNDLLAFGKELLSSVDEQVSALDEKAMWLVGFSGATLAIVFPRRHGSAAGEEGSGAGRRHIACSGAW